MFYHEFPKEFITIEDAEKLKKETTITVKDNETTWGIYSDFTEPELIKFLAEKLIFEEKPVDCNESISDSRKRSEANRIGYAIYNGIRAVHKLPKDTPERTSAACSMIAAISALYNLDADYASRLVSQVNGLI